MIRILIKGQTVTVGRSARDPLAKLARKIDRLITDDRLADKIATGEVTIGEIRSLLDQAECAAFGGTK